MALTTETLRRGIARVQSKIDTIGPEMNELDGRLGDGDLGVTLINGFHNMAKVADTLPDDVGMALFGCAKAMTQVSGSSFGTLMATALMAAGKQAKGESDVEWSRFPELLASAQEAMILRGGASLGDKTLLDSTDAVIAATREQNTPNGLQEAALKAASDALDAFRDKPNRIGRARIFGDRTIGMDDPGMVAFLRLIQCFDDG
ncbi:dihydroxyacetone kinase subunit L [Pelagibius litoralis]|uniref:Dihydroxyacetone kinase subunit L n=1 Tax=Pelagibius litoralis TaxID=374515 RepID=A0A967EZQ7_9PROT|nr:dihydroxyacetone kinase subunit L [Pelagibius litoralis]NIA70382.1 dihydroxyacetone kinase subunit L [Pelagibius litoralis]